MQIEIDDFLKAIAASAEGARKIATIHPAVGRYCILRCQKAGVHAGIVDSVTSEWICLRDSRRLWRWHSGFTLSEASLNGLDEAKSGLSAVVPEIWIPLHDVAEILPCSERARQNICSIVSSSADD